eukprot:CAMPEP_0184698874 /NCGR_PEP_ID=MMETSP0313-20130426/5329_1 /TAXON_ID=2792 /ORGANISM="Porphyridium aerugineum, Strain SAG 1380-2" /LENGTH=865 /DNA_ID=CAMNT_0027157869 /DNA_START=357 /DNA_END=2951 /DNA_ORIENTATION=+
MNGSQDTTSRKTTTTLTGGIPGIPAETYQAFNSVENPAYVASGSKVRNRSHVLNRLWSSPVMQRIQTKANSKSVFVGFAFAVCLMTFFLFIESYHAPESVLGEEHNPNMVLYSPSQPFPFDFINDLAISLDNPIAPITPIDSRVPEDTWPGDASKKDASTEAHPEQHLDSVPNINTDLTLSPDTQGGSSSVDISGSTSSSSDVRFSESEPRSVKDIETVEAKEERESHGNDQETEADTEREAGRNHPASDPAKEPDDNMEETNQSQDAGTRRDESSSKPVDDNEEETNQHGGLPSQPQSESQGWRQAEESHDNVDSAESQAETRQGDDTRDSARSVHDNTEESQDRDDEDSSRTTSDISRDTDHLDKVSEIQNESKSASTQNENNADEPIQIGESRHESDQIVESRHEGDQVEESRHEGNQIEESRRESDEVVEGANQAGETHTLGDDRTEERSQSGDAHNEHITDEGNADTRESVSSGLVEHQDQPEIDTRDADLRKDSSGIVEHAVSNQETRVDHRHGDDQEGSTNRHSRMTERSSKSAPKSASKSSSSMTSRHSQTLSSSKSSASRSALSKSSKSDTSSKSSKSSKSRGTSSGVSSGTGASLSSKSMSALRSSNKSANVSKKKLVPKVPVLKCLGKYGKVKVNLPASVKSQPWRQVFFVFSHRRSGTHATVEFLQEQFQTRAKIFKINDHSPADHYMGCDALAWYRRYGRIIYVYRDPADTLVSMWHYLKNYAFDSHQMVNLTDYIRERNLFSLGMCPSMEYKFQCLRKPAAKDSLLRKLNRVQYLRYHRESWARYPDVFLLNFKDLMSSPGAVLSKIEEFFGVERTNRGTVSRPKPSIKTVFYRGGASDASKEFSSEDLEW